MAGVDGPLDGSRGLVVGVAAPGCAARLAVGRVHIDVAGRDVLDPQHRCGYPVGARELDNQERALGVLVRVLDDRDIETEPTDAVAMVVRFKYSHHPSAFMKSP